MHRYVLWLSLCALGCASAPSAFSVRSAASPETASAPRAVIGRALTEVPPAPGASAEGWAGLAASGPADPMAGMHHHHHPGMVMPDGTVMPAMSAPSEETPDAH